MKSAAKSDVPTWHHFLRRMRKQLRAARRASGDEPDGLEEVVHEIRKRLKSVRALLRFLRPIIGVHHARQQNHALRKIARALAPLREAQVHLRTCRRLAPAKGPGVTQLRRVLRERLAAARAAAPGRRQIGKELRAAQDRLKDLPPADLTGKELREGLARMQRAAQRAARRVRTSPSVEAFHTWRRCVKDLGYVLPIFAGNDGESVQQCGLEKLGHLLGDEHDLALFEAVLAEHLAGPEHDRLLVRIVARRAALREAALALGAVKAPRPQPSLRTTPRVNA